MNCYRIHQKSLNFIYPFKFYSNYTNKNVSWLHFSWPTYMGMCLIALLLLSFMTNKVEYKSETTVPLSVNAVRRIHQNTQMQTVTLRAKLSGAVCCNRSCLFVGLWLCLFVCGFIGKGSDHLQLFKFWPSSAPRKGVCGGAKFFLAPPYYSQRAAFASLRALFRCFFCSTVCTAVHGRNSSRISGGAEAERNDVRQRTHHPAASRLGQPRRTGYPLG